ncbi:stimulator of interferon genes protein [Battus philenor]|uniref:stimulator of interferon genes protein n=1 Tax=Battus philenor TaxID=42288 RepID=UPI0035D04EC9
MVHSTYKMNDKTVYIYGCQIIFACAITYGYQGIHLENANKWITTVARYVLYMLIIKGSTAACLFNYSVIRMKEKINVENLFKDSRKYILIFFASISTLMYSNQKILDQDFLLWFIAYLIAKYPEMESKAAPTITYGVGMACSFFETYLMSIIPSDGADFIGLEDNMEKFSSRHGIVFPVKRLFIVITKSLYCPPDLKAFNKNNREDLPYLEACLSLEDVQKDFAGVKNRTFRNSTYKIYRPGKSPVYLVAECATPLHTLYRVLQKTALYEALANVNAQEIADDFCSMLTTTIAKSPECRNKCELVFYDDTDPSQNLADVLLNKIRELEPNFENIKKC